MPRGRVRASAAAAVAGGQILTRRFDELTCADFPPLHIASALLSHGRHPPRASASSPRRAIHPSPSCARRGSNFPRHSSALLTSQSATSERLRCPVHDDSSNFLLALPTTRCIITHRDLQPIDCKSSTSATTCFCADINSLTVVDSQLNTARGPLNP